MRQSVLTIAVCATFCLAPNGDLFGQSRLPVSPQHGGERVNTTLALRMPVWLIEPDTTARLLFYNLKEYLAPSEELVVESVNAQVLHVDVETLVFRPQYQHGANNGYVALLARGNGEERLLGAIHFASEEIPYDGPEDVRIYPERAMVFPEVYDYETNRTIGFRGFFTGGPLKNWGSFDVEYQQGSAAPDRPKRLPKWVEAELEIPIGRPGSSIPPSALPVRPRDCRGFENGRKTADGVWVNVGMPTPVESRECGSISAERGTTYTRQLCGKAAAEFAANLGIKLPLPGQSIQVGGNMKVKGELNGCITVTVTNTTGTRLSIICRTTRVNQLKIRDVFCCRDGVPYLCERWVCYRYVDRTTSEIPALGIVFPGVGSPSPETCTRTD